MIYGIKSKSVVENKFEINKSKIDGNGALALKPIKKGELICRMRGEEISISELKKRHEIGRERLCDPLQVRESRFLDLFEPYVYINHSCESNAAIVKFNELIAIKDIGIGEEITYDYSLTEWSNDKSRLGHDDWSMECNCKSPLCRGKIREFRFLPKNIQEKYVKQRLVQDHIIRKYKKCYEE